MSQFNIPIIYSRIISSAVTGNKYIAHKVLIDAGLDRHHSGYMSKEQYQKLLRSAVDLSEDPLIACKAGINLPFSAHGPLGIAAICSQTVGQAMDTLASFAKLRIPFGNIENLNERNLAVTTFSLEENLGDVEHQAIDFVLATFASAFPGVIATPLKHCAIELDRPEPDNSNEYHRLFQVPIKFNAGRNAIILAREDRDIRLLGSNEEEYEKALDRLKSLYQPYSNQTGLDEKLTHFFSQNIGHLCSLEEVADSLFLTPRTLQRRLRAEQLNFRDIRDQWLAEQAHYYLTTENLSVEVTANLLGYSDASNFRRFFKKYFQEVPSELKK